MEVIVNDKGNSYSDRYMDAVKDVFTYFLLHNNYQSPEIMKENTLEVIDMFTEILTFIKETRKQDRRQANKILRRLWFFKRALHYTRNRQALLTRIYNFVLSLEGSGLLRGFGFSNIFGDRIMGDSEKISLRRS